MWMANPLLPHHIYDSCGPVRWFMINIMAIKHDDNKHSHPTLNIVVVVVIVIVVEILVAVAAVATATRA